MILLLAEGCGRDGGVIGTVAVRGVRGSFVIEDSLRTAPLTATRHSIYYVANDERHLIFQGAGGAKPALSLLKPDILLVRYCGGKIEKTEAFIESPTSESGIVRALTVQPIIAAGLSADGRSIC